MANPFTNATLSGSAIVDFSLNPTGSTLNLLFSNKAASATPPGPIAERVVGTMTIHEIGDGTTDGPCRVVPFTQQPMEIQMLGQALVPAF